MKRDGRPQRFEASSSPKRARVNSPSLVPSEFANAEAASVKTRSVSVSISTESVAFPAASREVYSISSPSVSVQVFDVSADEGGLEPSPPQVNELHGLPAEVAVSLPVGASLPVGDSLPVGMSLPVSSGKESELLDEAAVTLRECAPLRAMVYGTSNFLICLGLTCNLTLNTILMGLRLHHRGRQFYLYSKTDRRAFAAAALCLAWKHWEDREGLKHGHRIRDLARAIFLLARRNTNDFEPGLAAVHWACRDGGAELRRLRDRIKLQELLLLRALKFHIVMNDARFFAGIFPVALRKLCPLLEQVDLPRFDAVYSLALGIVMDFFRWPLAMDYDLRDVVSAAVFKAAVSLRVSVREEEQSDFFTLMPALPNLLEDLRLSYDWADTILQSNACEGE